MQIWQSMRVVLVVLLFALALSGTDSSGAQTNTSTEPDARPQAQALPQVEQDKLLADLAKSIEGREKEPAETVWKNIQSFKGRPAAVIPRAMNGFSRALGVSCAHCHVVGQWEKDDLAKKQIARDMVAMVEKIDSELLKNIKNLGSANPQVSCSTCHRGQTKPEIRLPNPKQQPGSAGRLKKHGNQVLVRA